MRSSWSTSTSRSSPRVDASRVVRELGKLIGGGGGGKPTLAEAGGKHRRAADALAAAEQAILAASREGARARLRLRAHRRRRLRPDRHARAARRRRRAGAQRGGPRASSRSLPSEEAGAGRRRAAADAARRARRAGARDASSSSRRCAPSLDVPVETFDERFTTDARAQTAVARRRGRPRRRAPSLRLPGMASRRRRGAAVAAAAASRLAAAAVLRCVAGGARIALARGSSAAGRRRRAHVTDGGGRRRRSRCGSSSRRVSRASQMAAADRRRRAIAIAKRQRAPRRGCRRSRTCRDGTAPPAGFGAKDATATRGLPLPGDYDFTGRRRRSSSSTTSSQAFDGNWRKVDLHYARSKNLTPYDVLIIASMVEKETLAPDERPLVAAVIYNRLQAGMPLGIDATIRYGLNVPGTRVAARVAARQRQPVQHAQASRGCRRRRSRTRASPRSRRRRIRRRSTTSTSCASRTRCTTSSPRASTEFLRKACEYGFGCNGPGCTPRRAGCVHSVTIRGTTTLVGAARLTRSRTRSRRGCRTPRSRRSGSTGPTSPLRRRPSGSRRPCAGCSARLRGRERDDPAQAAAVALCDEVATLRSR